MAAVMFVLTGIGLAICAGLIGMVMVAAIEVVIAYRDPARAEVIRAHSWRENLHRMLH
jgi:hypothetical protein